MTLTTPLNVVDYSDGRPRLSRLRSLGYVGVCRYLWYRGITDQRKALTKDEADRIHAAGLEIVLNFESTATRMRKGYAYGRDDAKDALVSLEDFGVPADRPVYFSADWDVQVDDFPGIDQYLAGAAAVLGKDRIGGYGSYRFVRHLYTLGYRRWRWQTFGWSYGKVASGIALYQHQNHVTVAGATVDLDWAYRPDFGGWGPSLPDSSTEDPMDLSKFSIYATPKRLKVPKGTHLYDGLDLNEATAVIVSPGRYMPLAGKFDAGPYMVGLTPDDGSTPDPKVDWRLVKPGDVGTAEDYPVPAPDCTAAIAAATDPLETQISGLEDQLSAAQAATTKAVADAIAKTKASAKVGVIFEEG